MADNELRNWAAAAYLWIVWAHAKLEPDTGEEGEVLRGPGGHPVPPPPPPPPPPPNEN